LGVAQAYRRDENVFEFAIEQNYPWNNVIDKDGEWGVWEKYNLTNLGGATFLINTSGKIIEINPKTSDLEEILENSLL